MKFELTLPRLNLKNAMLSLSLFLLLTSFIAFNMHLIKIYKLTLESLLEPAFPLIEEFIAGEPQPTSLVSELMSTSPFHISSDLTTFPNTSDCPPFHNVSHFEPSTNYNQSTKLPQWMKEYFDWHREQTSKINRCNFRDYKYLTMKCTKDNKKCGGVADRLKSLPFIIATAAKYKRIFLIRWTRPAKLEEFLLPNEINWAVPDWMYEELGGFLNTTDTYRASGAKKVEKTLRRPSRRNTLFIESLIQDFYGGSSKYYLLDCEMDENKEADPKIVELSDFAGWYEYEIIFRDLFYTLFQSSPPVAKLVRDKMMSSNLIPGKFSSCHYRAFYAVEHEKDKVELNRLTSKAENGLNCATFMQAGDPVYFASDSDVAVQFARNMSESTGRKIVTFDHKHEALHLDKMYQWKTDNIADFYATFVDLLIMAESKCMSHGLGGYGAFANLLSIDSTCVIRHDNFREANIEECDWYDTPPSHHYW